MKTKRVFFQQMRMPSPQFLRAVTLVELMLVVAILSVIAAIAYPSYKGYLDRVNFQSIVVDLKTIPDCIERASMVFGRLPLDLNEGGCGKLDPWGTPYAYHNFSTAHGVGRRRKDRNLNPINTFYDLYSKGKDGRSTSPLTARHSRDDIIRANDGGFIGLASDF